ncbi:helix-turn-helix domain-containing protein [Aneurinibacillus tyrosinisolvens]|uniref:helix-turn-helix domain-containing protein n=1 Tax=Aneurinibacillus tyrosinisolvens TaxID=1443435 RepID=UPI00063F494E|nr:helix-turn-helix domain-containing protein [Aneurinibacillus tyrosinisolvens]
MNFAEVKQYQSFHSLNELNEAVRAFLYCHKAELSEGVVKVLKFVWKHSCKVFGVSFAKIAYIVDGTKTSKSTVVRAINTLEEYGIVKRVPTTKPNGKRGVNLLVLQVVEGASLPTMTPQYDTVDETPTESDKANGSNDSKPISEGEALSKQCSFQESKDKKNSNNVKEPTLEQLDSSYTPSHIPSAFIDAVKPFLNAHGIYRMYGVVQSAKRRMKVLDVSMDVIIDAWKQSVFAYKAGIIKKTLAAYFHGTLCTMIGIEKRRETEMFNWLEWEEVSC